MDSHYFDYLTVRLTRMEERQVRLEVLLRSVIRLATTGNLTIEPTDEHEAQEMTPLDRFRP